MRWSGNITLLFRELPFVERIFAARDAGFDAIEFWWPRSESLDKVAAAVKAAALPVALINMEAGDLEAGDRGFLNDPARRADVLNAAATASEFARDIGCAVINVPVGKDIGGPRDKQLAQLRTTLGEIAELTEAEGQRLVLEPLSSVEHPTYLMCSTRETLDLIGEVGHGIGLLYDTYHMGGIGEDIVEAAKQQPIAHVQLADFPGRHQPGTGRLPLIPFLDALAGNGYTGYVGVEYIPVGRTPDSLQWWREYKGRGT